MVVHYYQCIDSDLRILDISYTMEIMGNHMKGLSHSEDDKSSNVSSSCPNITKVDIELPEVSRGKLAFVLHNVLSQEECDAYVKKTEGMGYETALVNVGFGQQRLMTDVRNNDRCIWDSVEEADKLFQRIKSYLPQSWRDRALVSLNERLRCLRYDPGEYFKPHMDGNYTRKNGETSFVTVQLYLNEGFQGGSTTFLGRNFDERVECVPKTGAVLIFQHDIFHEGSILEKGRKYCIRTDVMYAAR